MKRVAVIFLAVIALLQTLEGYDLLNQYYLHILTIIGMNIILVASVNLLNGYLGEFTLGHAGFMAIGAYAAAFTTSKIHLPMIPQLLVALVAAMAVSALIGYVIGLLTFKTVGDYLAIITLGFNMIIINAIQNMDWLGGPRGFTDIPNNTNLLVVAICVVGTYVILYRLVHSGYGRVWVAIRENAIAAELMGVHVNRAKNLAFVVSALFAGLAGGLWAQYQQFITPRSFDYVKMTEILVMLYLGGMASLSGSIVGVVVYTILLEILRNALSFDPRLVELRMMVGPVILIVVMLTRQYGLMGNREWKWLQ